MSIIPNGTLYSNTGHHYLGPALTTASQAPAAGQGRAAPLPPPLQPGHSHLSHLSQSVAICSCPSGPVSTGQLAGCPPQPPGRPVLPASPRIGPHFTASHARQPGSLSPWPSSQDSGSPLSTRAPSRGMRTRGPCGHACLSQEGSLRYSHCFPTACGFQPLLLGAVTLIGNQSLSPFP